MASTLPYRKDIRGRSSRYIPKNMGHKSKRGTTESFSPLFNLDFTNVKSVGGGFRRSVNMDVNSDHEVWMDFITPAGRSDRQVNELQTLTVLVLEVAGESASLGFEVKEAGEEQFAHKQVKRWDTVVIKPGSEFRFYGIKNTTAALYCCADSGYSKFVEVIDAGSEHVLDDLKAHRQEKEAGPRSARNRPERSRAEREAIANRAAKAKNGGKHRLTVVVDAASVADNASRGTSQGLNAKPMGESAYTQLAEREVTPTEESVTEE